MMIYLSMHIYYVPHINIGVYQAWSRQPIGYG